MSRNEWTAELSWSHCPTMTSIDHSCAALSDLSEEFSLFWKNFKQLERHETATKDEAIRSNVCSEGFDFCELRATEDWRLRRLQSSERGSASVPVNGRRTGRVPLLDDGSRARPGDWLHVGLFDLPRSEMGEQVHLTQLSVELNCAPKQLKVWNDRTRLEMSTALTPHDPDDRSSSTPEWVHLSIREDHKRQSASLTFVRR